MQWRSVGCRGRAEWPVTPVFTIWRSRLIRVRTLEGVRYGRQCIGSDRRAAQSRCEESRRGAYSQYVQSVAGFAAAAFARDPDATGHPHPFQSMRKPTSHRSSRFVAGCMRRAPTGGCASRGRETVFGSTQCPLPQSQLGRTGATARLTARIATRAAALALLAIACGGHPTKVDPPRTPAQITLISGNDQTGDAGATLRDPLVVEVDDAGGKPLGGASVVWRVTFGGGSVVPASSVTDAQGRSQATMALGRVAGPDSAIAELSGSSITPARFSAIGVAGPVSIIAIVPALLDLQIGDSRPLRADLTDALGNALRGASVTWASGAPSIASVSAAGLVTALSAGGASITATAQGKMGTASVTVAPPPVARLQITSPDTTLAVGRRLQLTAIASDAGGTPVPGAVIAWASSAPSTVSVSSAGLVVALTPGSAQISALSQGKSDTVAIQVTPGPVAQLRIQAPKTALFLRDTVRLSAVARDSAANIVSGRATTWSSSAPSIATVTPVGLVTAISTGVTLIRATVDGVSDTVTIKSMSESIGIYSETTPVLRPDVDTYFGIFSGLGAIVTEFRDDSSTWKDGTVSLRTTARSSGNGFAGLFVAWGDNMHYADNNFTRDMSKYAGGSIRFWTRTPVDLEIGIRSGNVTAGAEASKTLLSRLGVVPAMSWQWVCIPLAPLTGASPLADLGHTKIFFVASVNQTSGGTGGLPVTFWFDDVRWDTAPC